MLFTKLLTRASHLRMAELEIVDIWIFNFLSVLEHLGSSTRYINTLSKQEGPRGSCAPANSGQASTADKNYYFK